MLASLLGLVNKAAADATDQAVLRRLAAALAKADAWVKTYCGWAIEAADYTEYHSPGRGDLVLNQMHVTRLSGATVDDPAIDYGVWYDPLRVYGSDTLLTADTHYRLTADGDAGIIRRLSSGWGWASGWPGYGGGVETVKVVYRAGYEEDEIPADLEGAVLDVALQMYKSDLASQQITSGGGSAAGTVKSIRRGQSQITYMTAAELGGGGGGTSTSTVGGGDPYGVNTTLDLYRDWRAA